jgi:hypothetical protein
MNTPETAPEILTLGSFSISVDGKPVAADWPDEALKVFFCSLLSPLDLYITWDRICRSMCDEPSIQAGLCRMEEVFIQPLNGYLIRELGFSPLITGNEGIRIDRQRVYVDALEFHSTAVEGLRLLSRGSHAAAHEKFSRAKALYNGIYLPGLSGMIIENTRNELASLYQTAIIDAMPLSRKSGSSGRSRRSESGRNLKTSADSGPAAGSPHEESLYQGYRIF